MRLDRRDPTVLTAFQCRQIVVAQCQIVLKLNAGRILVDQSLQDIDRFLSGFFRRGHVAVSQYVTEVVAGDRQIAGRLWLIDRRIGRAAQHLDRRAKRFFRLRGIADLIQQHSQVSFAFGQLAGEGWIGFMLVDKTLLNADRSLIVRAGVCHVAARPTTGPSCCGPLPVGLARRRWPVSPAVFPPFDIP